MKQKLFTLFLALLASVGIASAQSGTRGDNLTWTLSNDTLTISGTGAMADYTYNTMPWYKYRSSIQSVIITDGVTSIGSHAFYNCYSLTSITIPKSVTSIGESAFAVCFKLSSVTIPNSVTSIGDGAFSDCYSLTSITIPNSVTSIGIEAFYECSSLSSITIPNSVTSIGNQAFENCTSLTSINVNSNNPNYSSVDGVLFNKDKTTLIQCPCRKQGAYTIPNSVTSIEWGAFLSCKSLTSITIPNSVTSIVIEAFENCTSLTSINVVNDNPNYCSVDGVLFYKDKTTLVAYPGGKQGAYTIPNSVTSIGSDAFSGCSSLTSITIPNSVTSIGNQAFENCTSLTSVTIPNSVTSIGSGAFAGCYSLTSVTFESITPPIIKKAFNNTNNCPIYVPCGTKEAYVTALNENDTIDESRVIEKSPYTYSVASSDNTLGSVTIMQEPTTCAEPLIFRADAAEGYQFTQWSDGNTDNPRSLVLTQDTTFTAEFEDAKYTVIWQDEEGNVIKEDKVMQGEMPEYIGEEPAKDSTAEYSYVFAGWLPRIKPVTENVRYTTYFIPQKLTPEKVYTVNINGENCSLNISNEYPEGAVVTVEAVADDCFKFEKWSDNNTDNPRTITVTEDSVLTAEFTKLIYTIKGANQSSTGGSVQVVNP